MISEKAPKVVDSKRHEGTREYAVQKHFYGEYGLSEELIAAGILDPLTGLFDPVRLLNMDETPEQLDVSISKNNSKVGAACNASCVLTNNEDKTSYTETLTFGADGFQYVPQLIFAGREFSTSLADAFITKEQTPEYVSKFDNKIVNQISMSSHLLISTTECGMKF